MGLTACKECGKPVPIQSLTCSGCGVDRPGAVTEAREVQAAAQETARTERAARRDALVGKVGAAVVALAVVGFIVFAVVGDDEDSGAEERDEPRPPSEFAAEVACEDFVEEQLKSPSTADFSDQVRTSTGPDTFEVVGNVDAQNGFGATVRAAWSCSVKATPNGDGYSWTLLRPVEITQR